MNTLKRLSLLAAVATAVLVSSPAQSSTQTGWQRYHRVKVKHPLTGRVRSTKTFNSYTAARSYYNKLRLQYWVIVKPTFGRPRYVHGGTKLQADLKAVALSIDPGQKAFSKRKTVRFSRRVITR